RGTPLAVFGVPPADGFRYHPPMPTASRHLLESAQHLARKVAARALVLYADAVPREELRQLLRGLDFPAILATRSGETRGLSDLPSCTWVTLPDVYLSRAAQLKSALLICLARQLLRQGDRIVFVAGADRSGTLDTVLVFNVGTLPELFSLADAAAFAGD